MTPEALKELKASLQEPVYKPLVEYLTLQTKGLRDIENVREFSKAQDQALEFKATLKAKRIVEAILDRLVAIKETPEPEAPEEGNDYGIDTKTE